jgi:glutamate synthase (NADPH/NADH) small chain
VRALRLAEVALEGGRLAPVPGSAREIPCELVLLAMGFTGAEQPGLVADLGVELDARGNVARDASYATSVPGVFVAGDMGRGQSLIVWAIAEGRSAAAAVDRHLLALEPSSVTLPAPIAPTARPLA